MLQVYFSSIIIWFVIMSSLLIVNVDKIVKNGWVNSNTNGLSFSSFATALLLCAIPVFRLAVCIASFVMASMTPEEWEQYKKDNNKGDE